LAGKTLLLTRKIWVRFRFGFVLEVDQASLTIDKVRVLEKPDFKCPRRENLVHLGFASFPVADFEAETGGESLTVMPIKTIGTITCYSKTLEEHELYRSTLLGPAQPPAYR